MSEKNENEEIAGHEYDGIKELNNPLPGWWLWTFLLTIIFGFHYWIHYEFGGGANQTTELREDMARIDDSHKGHSHGQEKSASEDDLKKLLAANDVVAKGKTIFQGKCAVCHGNELQGIIGPNLVDEYWIHGKGRLADILQVVRAGVPEKGMPPWEGQLSPDDIQAVTVFVYSAYGTQPPQPKAPQGEKVVGH